MFQQSLHKQEITFKVDLVKNQEDLHKEKNTHLLRQTKFLLNKVKIVKKEWNRRPEYRVLLRQTQLLQIIHASPNLIHQE